MTIQAGFTPARPPQDAGGLVVDGSTTAPTAKEGTMAQRPIARGRAGASVRRSSSRVSRAAWFIALVVVARAAAAGEIVPPLLPADQVPRPVAASESRPLLPASRIAALPGSNDAAEHGTSEKRAALAAPVGAVDSQSTASGPAGGALAAWWQSLDAMPVAVLLGSVIVGAIVLRAMAARRLGGGARPDGVIEVLARYPIGRGQQIVVLRIGRRVVVAHQADRSMRTLSESSDPDEVAEIIAKARTQGSDLFARLLDRSKREVDPFAEAEMVDLTRARSGGARR